MITLLWAVVALAQDAEPSAPSRPDPEAIEVRIDLTEFSVDPQQLEIPAGRPVRLFVHNKGSVTHSLAVPELNVATDVLQPGEVQVLTFTAREPGRYETACAISGHREVGAIGKLVVSDAVVASPATAEAPASPE